jgi:hypothetical protein
MLVAALGAGPANGGRAPAAQQEPMPGVPQMPSADQPSAVPGSVRAHMDAQQQRMLNDDRHKRMEDDAAKLVALSNELKTEVDKTGKDELSLDVIRKAAEIEKLAHDVQSRMKD